MCPPQLSPQCGDNLFIRKRLGKLDHVSQIFRGKPSAELRLQLSPQRGGTLISIFCSFLLEKVDADVSANLPIQRRQRSVHRRRLGFNPRPSRRPGATTSVCAVCKVLAGLRLRVLTLIRHYRGPFTPRSATARNCASSWWISKGPSSLRRTWARKRFGFFIRRLFPGHVHISLTPAPTSRHPTARRARRDCTCSPDSADCRNDTDSPD